VNNLNGSIPAMKCVTGIGGIFKTEVELWEPRA
jgi:hypothetical protein